MNYLRITGMSSVLAAICALPLACSASDQGSESGDTLSQAIAPGQCTQAVAKDVLIAELVKDSVVSGYPLTRLSADASGAIGGADLPDSIAGDLEIINTVVEARDSVARALAKISGLAEYDAQGIGPDTSACTGVPAWTPNGSTTIDTVANEVFVGDTNHDSWVKVQKEFGKECPLVKRLANKDIIDPPCDGSTSEPPSNTVSEYGVTANAFGLCPAGTSPWTFCKQFNATGVNYAGRSCQQYYGSLRCLLY